MVPYILIAIIAYAIGSINFSVIFSRKFAGFDVREKGSGNAGNMLRSVGKKAAALTLVCDILKGIVAIVIALIMGNVIKEFNGQSYLVQIAAVAVVIGHTFPIFFEFRGGKGVATSLVNKNWIFIWQIGLICLIFALALMAVTKMVSLGSISAAILFPVLTLFIHSHYIVEGNGYFIFSIILAAIVCFNHRANIKRIMNGTENKFGSKK